MGATRLISVSRELTKLFEETKTGSMEEVWHYFQQKEVKGEIVVVIHGKEN
jgi:16S rRNA (cytidine1402-2'-O)-methyltransferase